MDIVIGIKNTATYCGVCRNTVLRHIKDGNFPQNQNNVYPPIFKKVDLATWMDKWQEMNARHRPTKHIR